MFTPELELRAIQIFLAVGRRQVSQKSFRETQNFVPAISQALRLLEEDLGTELFCPVMFVLYD